ncbi:SAV_6107 family HEPN domain-containing protein [Allonocardiopsis opalescens]|uniref:SAV-6107-like HEPN domain-containing protein n=1 Tax=Allonocardiopsis opalescens TaxID=1144618 RepID=A0A2T0PZM3_9ACTN|nr:SAV_6107 family HEPN domain-containing protein [Allonocardiopsis opalescens]PRX96984.1 hypothetical protein CLV72_10619 [Allonocardiopsis opalescens]
MNDAPTGSDPTLSTVSDQPKLSPSVLAILSDARRHLLEAIDAPTPGLRYVEAHLAALRAAATVVAARSHPLTGTGRRRVRSAWELLSEAAPELNGWAAFFAGGADKRAAAEAGQAVAEADADALMEDAQTFLALVETTLGLPGQPVLPLERRRP